MTRKKQICLWGIGAIVLLVLAVGLWLWSVSRSLGTELARIRTAGEPVSAVDLYPSIPEGVTGDAGEMYLRAFALFHPPNPETADQLRTLRLAATDPTQPGVPEAQITTIRTLVNSNVDALTLIDGAAHVDRCDFVLGSDIGGFMDPNNYGPVRRVQDLIIARAFLERIEGHTDRAADSVIGGLALLRVLQNQPLLGHLVAIHCLSITARAAVRLAADSTLSSEQLHGLIRALRNCDRSDLLHQAFLAERVYGLMLTGAIPGGKNLPGAWSQNTMPFFARQYYAKSYARFMRQAIESAGHPFPMALDQLDRLRPDGLLTGPLVPTFASASEGTATAVAEVRSAAVAIAIVAYRQKHGNLPESLDVLVPEYLSDLPIDPFDGSPIKYGTDGSSRIIYSIGPDRQDDGGSISADPNAKPIDIGFRVTP